MSKIYGYTVTTPMNPHKARAVFVGNENTTLAEFFEAYQNKKACFLYRPRGGSGYEQWTLYHANTSQARFYMIEQNGKIMVGTLKSDGNWSYVIHEVGGSVSEDQIISVLESYLEDNPIKSGGGFVASDTPPEDTSLLWVDTSDNSGGGGSGDVDLSGYAKIEDVPTDDHINDLIRIALGVIENGTY